MSIEINGILFNRNNLTAQNSFDGVGFCAETNPSIFNTVQNKDLETTESNDSSKDTKVNDAIDSAIRNCIAKYNPNNLRKQAKKIETNLKSSDKFPIIGSFVFSNVERIAGEIYGLFGSLTERCESCQTEEEAKSVIADIEKELQQKQYEAKVLIHRGDKSIELDRKFASLGNDSSKSKFVDNIDFSKIISKLMEPVDGLTVDGSEDTSTEETTGNAQQNSTEKDMNEAIKDDEISKVITGIIEYGENGNDNSVISGYIKDDNMSENITSADNQSENNTSEIQNNVHEQDKISDNGQNDIGFNFVNFFKHKKSLFN